MMKVMKHQYIKGILIGVISGVVVNGIMILLNEYVLQATVKIPDWWRGYVTGALVAIILRPFLKD